MTAPSAEWSFRSVASDGNGGALLIAGRDGLTERHVPISYALHWRDGWTQMEVPFIANSIARSSGAGEIGLVAGVYAHLLYWDVGGATESRVDPSNEGPQHFGDITELRTIKGRRYVVGMSRTAYREVAGRSWERIDYGVRVDDDEDEDDDKDPGFTSIDGFSDDNIYAVGWDGEIWHYDGQSWERIDSPTDVALQRVVCGRDGWVYACGMRGAVLRGHDDRWQVINEVPTADTFWGACWFSDWLYLSTANGIYRLEDDAVREVSPPVSEETELPRGMSFYRLDADADRLWSVGRRKVLVTDNGALWNEIPLP